jgi:site-specific DNA recombinase
MHPIHRSDARPEQFERRARLVSAISRGRRWLDDVVLGWVTTIAELCSREKCSTRQINMTISLAFLAPNLVKAAVEGRLPRGIGVERLRDPPTGMEPTVHGARTQLGIIERRPKIPE